VEATEEEQEVYVLVSVLIPVSHTDPLVRSSGSVWLTGISTLTVRLTFVLFWLLDDQSVSMSKKCVVYVHIILVIHADFFMISRVLSSCCVCM
jgi:hypothetical protein